MIAEMSQWFLILIASAVNIESWGGKLVLIIGGVAAIIRLFTEMNKYEISEMEKKSVSKKTKQAISKTKFIDFVKAKKEQLFKKEKEKKE